MPLCSYIIWKSDSIINANHSEVSQLLGLLCLYSVSMMLAIFPNINVTFRHSIPFPQLSCCFLTSLPHIYDMPGWETGQWRTLLPWLFTRPYPLSNFAFSCVVKSHAKGKESNLNGGKGVWMNNHTTLAHLVYSHSVRLSEIYFALQGHCFWTVCWWP